MTITHNDLLDALKAYLEPTADSPADGKTMREIAAELGRSTVDGSNDIRRLREAVRHMIAQGHMTPVKVRRVALDGRLGSVSGYRWVR